MSNQTKRNLSQNKIRFLNTSVVIVFNFNVFFYTEIKVKIRGQNQRTGQ